MPKPRLPSAINYWLAARAFHEAANTTFDKFSSSSYKGFLRTAVVFLYARSIALSLKACIRQHTSDSKIFLSEMGHRLDLMLDKAKELGISDELALSAGHCSTIALMGKDYSDKWFEYPDNIWTKRPKIDSLRQAAEFLFAKTQAYVDLKKSKTAHEC
jgi:hypothetical protein